MYVSLVAFGGPRGEPRQSSEPRDKRCGQICPADMEEFISITNVLHSSAKTKRNSPPPNGVLERKEGAVHRANEDAKTATCCFDLLGACANDAVTLFPS